MNSVIPIYKPVGYTPLQIIKMLRAQQPQYADATLGYAGRLDPMADGVLLILCGNMNTKRKEFERLKKRYTTEILFGIETDTYDIMGIVTKVHVPIIIPFDVIEKESREFLGTHEQPYPPYSSVLVKGKPLFYWARKNLIGEITIPKKMITVEDFRMTDIDVIDLPDLRDYVTKRIQKVDGNFRQDEILARWSEVITQSPGVRLTKATFDISCSSGTYIRSIAHDLGHRLGNGAIAYSITRTAVGEYELNTALRLREK